jgi:hypothetical protein
MKGKTPITVLVFVLCAAGIAVYAVNRGDETASGERHGMRVVVPNENREWGHGEGRQGRGRNESAYVAKAPMESGEFVVSVLSFDAFDRGVDDQVVVFRGAGESGLSIAFFAFDEAASVHRRVWDLPVSATVPATVSVSTLDLLGDRSACVIVTGMNDADEQTMTVFHRNPLGSRYMPFDVIADIAVDGSVEVRQSQRSQAYQQGVAKGQPFSIVASGRDPLSDNILDRIEFTYFFSEASGAYGLVGRVNIAGARIEQERVRGILSGAPGVFEEFVGDLWYHVTAEGTVERDQFIFFDRAGREIVFFGDNSNQIFVWQGSTITRQGIMISAHNRTVTAMKRRVNVELESMDGIRVSVEDESRARIGIQPPWSGSYRRAGSIVMPGVQTPAVGPSRDAVFDSVIGKFRFTPDGEYEIYGNGPSSGGRYVFFGAGGMDLLEMRPDSGESPFLPVSVGGGGEDRQVFLVSGISRNTRGQPYETQPRIVLSRVLLGASGIRDLNEAQIVLTLAE